MHHQLIHALPWLRSPTTETKLRGVSWQTACDGYHSAGPVLSSSPEGIEVRQIRVLMLLGKLVRPKAFDVTRLVSQIKMELNVFQACSSCTNLKLHEHDGAPVTSERASLLDSPLTRE